MNKDEAIVVVSNLLERKRTFIRNISSIDAELKKLSKEFGLTIDLEKNEVVKSDN